jgi:hypothetical protein
MSVKRILPHTRINFIFDNLFTPVRRTEIKTDTVYGEEKPRLKQENCTKVLFRNEFSAFAPVFKAHPFLTFEILKDSNRSGRLVRIEDIIALENGKPADNHQLLDNLIKGRATGIFDPTNFLPPEVRPNRTTELTNIKFFSLRRLMLDAGDFTEFESVAFKKKEAIDFWLALNKYLFKWLNEEDKLDWERMINVILNELSITGDDIVASADSFIEKLFQSPGDRGIFLEIQPSQIEGLNYNELGRAFARCDENSRLSFALTVSRTNPNFFQRVVLRYIRGRG